MASLETGATKSKRSISLLQVVIQLSDKTDRMSLQNVIAHNTNSSLAFYVNDEKLGQFVRKLCSPHTY